MINKNLGRVGAFHVGLSAVGDPALQNFLHSGHQEDLGMGASDGEDALFGVLQGALGEPGHQAVAPQGPVPTVDVLPTAARTRRHLADQWVVEIHMEVGRYLSAVLDVEQGEDHVERLHLRADEETQGK